MPGLHVRIVSIDVDSIPDNVRAAVIMLIGRNKELEEQVRLLRAKLFARKSEKWTRADLLQALLFDEAELEFSKGAELFEGAREIRIGGHARTKPVRSVIPDEIPRREIIHDIADDEKRCACGAHLIRIGEEISEKLNIIPEQIYAERHIRPKYACRKCEGSGDETKPAVRIAAVPEAIIPKGLGASGLLAYVTASKFADHVPFYRQERIFHSRWGIELPRSTLCDWMIQVSERCLPVLAALKERLLISSVLGIDETTLQVMNEPGRKNTSKSYIWAYRSFDSDRPVLLYEYRPTRSGAFLNEMLKEYQGYVMTDGYVGYSDLSSRQGIVRAGCWAHARRYFKDAMDTAPTEYCGRVLDMIAELYAVERAAKDLPPKDRLELRLTKSKPVLKRIRDFLIHMSTRSPPKLLFGKAVRYALDQWPALETFLENGQIPIDNNLVENQIRPFVLGRKNWLFSGSPRGADASAGIYTLIMNARENGLEPYWYLRYLFENIPAARSPADYQALLPQELAMENIKPSKP